MVVLKEEVGNHSEVDKGVMYSLPKVRSGRLHTRMNKIIQQGMHGNIVNFLCAIRLEDKEHVDFVRMRRDGIEWFRH